MKELPKLNIFWMLVAAILVIPAGLGVASLLHNKLKHKSDVNDGNLRRIFYSILISTIWILIIRDDKSFALYPWILAIIYFVGLRGTYFIRTRIERHINKLK